MKRRFAVCFTVVCVFMLLSIGALHAKKKAPAEKPKIVFWQNEAGSGLSGWYKAVIEDINAREGFTVEMVENPIANVIDLLTAAGVSQSGFDITWDWSVRSSSVLGG